MNVNPDPRPGRWLLPLVVLGMVMFTYVFVNQLPGDGPADATTDPSASPGPTASTSIPDGSDPGAPGTTTPGAVPTPPANDAETAAYLTAMGAAGTELTNLQAALSSANAAWEAGGDGAYTIAQAAFTDLSAQVAAWRDGVLAIPAPAAMTAAHDSITAAANEAAAQSAAALDGLVNASGAEPRQTAVAAFDAAVTALGQALAAAGG